MPARGSSVITTIPSSSPKNKVPVVGTERIDLEKNGNTSEEGTKKNTCDTEQPNSDESIGRGSSKTEVKEEVDTGTNAIDGSNATLKKSYETDMI